MSQALTPLIIVLPALAVGVALGVWVGRRRGQRGAPAPPGESRAAVPADSGSLRGQALEVAAEPVLIVGPDGRLRDCNAAALTMFARHRAEVGQADAASLRTLVDVDGGRLDWMTLVERRAPWSGEVHVRLPDGSRQRATVRVVPVFGDDGAVAALVEVYHGGRGGPTTEREHFVQALDAREETEDEAALGTAEAIRRDLRLLALGFADIERVVRQYEQLLPAMRAEDPLTEAIAGLAAETSEVAATVDVTRLLEELPQVLDRVRARVQRLSGAPVAAGRSPD